MRKVAGVVDRDGLENRCTGNCTVSSNLTLSAIKKDRFVSVFFILNITIIKSNGHNRNPDGEVDPHF